MQRPPRPVAYLTTYQADDPPVRQMIHLSGGTRVPRFPSERCERESDFGHAAFASPWLQDALRRRWAKGHNSVAPDCYC